MAALILTQSDTELSLQQHLDLAPDLLQYNHRLVPDAESDEPLTMAAQPVPHPSTDRKRVKVYELRNNDWYDRGTGFCTASYSFVSPPVPPRASFPFLPLRSLLSPYCDRAHLSRATVLFADAIAFPQSEDGNQRDPRVLVESEEQPDRVLLETRISREDGFHKQQGSSRLK